MKLRTLVLATSLVALAACSCDNDDFMMEPIPASNATLGKELIDLKQALDEGAITHEQFIRIRAMYIGENVEED